MDVFGRFASNSFTNHSHLPIPGRRGSRNKQNKYIRPLFASPSRPWTGDLQILCDLRFPRFILHCRLLGATVAAAVAATDLKSKQAADPARSWSACDSTRTKGRAEIIPIQAGRWETNFNSMISTSWHIRIKWRPVPKTSRVIRGITC